MKLITKTIREQLVANATVREEAGGERADFPPVVKFFMPNGPAIWLVSELHGEDSLYGLCDMGMGLPGLDLGYFSLHDLRRFSDPLGGGVERDRQFEAKAPISVYAAAAEKAGHIVEDLDAETA